MAGTQTRVRSLESWIVEPSYFKLGMGTNSNMDEFSSRVVDEIEGVRCMNCHLTVTLTHMSTFDT